MDETLFTVPVADPPDLASKPACGGKRFVELPARDQLAFEPYCIDQFVPEEAYVRAVADIGAYLDFSALRNAYRGGGRPAYPPETLCLLLFYGYSIGVRSAREIARRLEHDLNFIWLAHAQRIDHRTISEFRRAFSPALRDLFVQIVEIGASAGLTKLGCVAFDGTKIAANARRGMRTADQLTGELQAVQRRIDELLAEADACDAQEDATHGSARGDELPPELADAQRRRQRLEEARAALEQSGQKTVSASDPQAPKQKIGPDLRPGYNAQAAVDVDSGFVLAQDVTVAQNDTEQLLPMLDQVQANVGRMPEVGVADCGFHSGAALLGLAERDANVYVSQQPPTPSATWGHDAFRYDPEHDRYLCPAGHALLFKTLRTVRKTLYRRYAVSTVHCKNCPLRGECISPKAQCRELVIGQHAALAAEMRERLASPEGRWARQMRKQSVEPTFGLIKAVLGLRQFLLRGLDGARIEFGLCCIGVNLRKLVGAARAGRLALPRPAAA